MSWVSQLVRIASSSCVGSNSESEWNFVVVIFRWRVSCAHQTADWTTCTRSYKNWTLTSWWKEGKKTKVCKKKQQKKNPLNSWRPPSSLSFLSELTETVLNVGGPNLYAVHVFELLVNVLCRKADFTVGSARLVAGCPPLVETLSSWPPWFSSFQICAKPQ